MTGVRVWQSAAAEDRAVRQRYLREVERWMRRWHLEALNTHDPRGAETQRRHPWTWVPRLGDGTRPNPMQLNYMFITEGGGAHTRSRTEPDFSGHADAQGSGGGGARSDHNPVIATLQYRQGWQHLQRKPKPRTVVGW
ncbi:hypothetical protein N9L19_00275 [bacterium]|nr:hypothetical protein [bacterium]